MDEMKIITPTGYLKIKITVDESVKTLDLGLTRTGVEIYNLDSNYVQFVPIPLSNERIVSLREGSYKVRAIVGEIVSEWAKADVKAGETPSRIFHFGK